MPEIKNAAGLNHHIQLEHLAKFAGADSVEYVDHPGGVAGEDVILTKGGEKLALRIRGNHMDGAFLVVVVPGVPPKR